jgi:hypothetical protein
MSHTFKENEIEDSLNEMVANQKKNIYALSQKIVPRIAPEDLLQPQDFPELDQDPNFRYEEGLLHGLESALMCIRAFMKGS